MLYSLLMTTARSRVNSQETGVKIESCQTNGMDPVRVKRSESLIHLDFMKLIYQMVKPV